MDNDCEGGGEDKGDGGGEGEGEELSHTTLSVCDRNPLQTQSA